MCSQNRRWGSRRRFVVVKSKYQISSRIWRGATVSYDMCVCSISMLKQATNVLCCLHRYHHNLIAKCKTFSARVQTRDRVRAPYLRNKIFKSWLNLIFFKSQTFTDTYRESLGVPFFVVWEVPYFIWLYRNHRIFRYRIKSCNKIFFFIYNYNNFMVRNISIYLHLTLYIFMQFVKVTEQDFWTEIHEILRRI